jgi:tellurite resistance protein TerA
MPNLNKIVLEKKGDSKKINLEKDQSGNVKTGEILIQLNWDKKGKDQKSTGFWGNLKKTITGSSDIDLDLGCFYEMRSGVKSVIDGVQFAHGKGGQRDQSTRQGRFTGQPWIWHSGDERSGNGDGENMFLNPKGLGDIKRIIVYCFIYEGVARWDETNAIATIKVPGNPEIVVEMGKQKSDLNMCALAELQIFGNDSIGVSKLVTFHDGHSSCDKAYSWGMQWTAGGK